MTDEIRCETIREWMSLAQDNQLGSVESRRIHEHMMTCPECRAYWNALMNLSHMFHAAPMIGPQPGFMLRLQARMAYREEQRRRAAIMLLLAVGVIALGILALPSVLSLIGLTGQIVLPHWMFTYIQSAWNWLCIAISSLADAAWLLLRYFAASSGNMTCLILAVVAAALVILWIPLMMRRMVTRATR